MNYIIDKSRTDKLWRYAVLSSPNNSHTVQISAALLYIAWLVSISLPNNQELSGDVMTPIHFIASHSARAASASQLWNLSPAPWLHHAHRRYVTPRAPPPTSRRSNTPAHRHHHQDDFLFPKFEFSVSDLIGWRISSRENPVTSEMRCDVMRSGRLWWRHDVTVIMM